MDVQLQAAKTASEAGDNKEAHLLLARLLKNEPRNVEAWYLLSTLVESRQQQLTFVRKALALDPFHEAARRRLAEIELAQAPPALATSSQPQTNGAEAMADMPEAEGPKAEGPKAKRPRAKRPKVEEPEAVGLEAVGLEAVGPEAEVPEAEVPEAARLEAAGDLEPAQDPMADTVVTSGARRSDSDDMDFLSQAESDTIPRWLAEEEPELAHAMPDVSPMGQDATLVLEKAYDSEPLPDWLQREANLEWLREAGEEDVGWEAATPTLAAAGAATTSRRAAKRPGAWVDTALKALIAVTFLVTIVLGVVVVITFF